MASLCRNANQFARLAPSHCRRGLASGAPAASVSGMNFNISEEQQELVDLAEKFTREEVIPNAAHYDQTGKFPWPIIKKAHELGLMNAHIPAKYGGLGLGTLVSFLILDIMDLLSRQLDI